MNLLAKTALFLAGAAAGAAVIGQAAGAGLPPPQAKSAPNAALNPARGPEFPGPSCARGFAVTDVYGPSKPDTNHGWTCQGPIVHCTGGAATLGQSTPVGGGSVRLSYKCVYIKF
jgi:hypothetical protein